MWGFVWRDEFRLVWRASYSVKELRTVKELHIMCIGLVCFAFLVISCAFWCVALNYYTSHCIVLLVLHYFATHCIALIYFALPRIALYGFDFVFVYILPIYRSSTAG